MSNITSNSSTSTTTIVDLSNQIKYIIFQICYILSIICCILTLAHFFLNRNLRYALHNHIPLALLLISMFDSLLNHPFTLNYLRIGQVIPSDYTMCLFWNFINSWLTITTFLTMAWGSLERHILIFYSTLYTTQRGRVLFHYIPLATVTLIYPLISHIIIYLLYPCQNKFNMMSLFCAYTCALKIPAVALYARIAHNFVPTSILLISTVALMLRVIKQKRHIQNNQFTWRRYRRMIIQLLALTSLFLFLTLPATIVSIIQSCCLPTFAMYIQTTYLNFLVRFLNIFMPFVCLSLLPEIWSNLLSFKKVKVRPVATIRGRTNPTL